MLALMLLLAWRARATEPMYRAARAKDDAAVLLLCALVIRQIYRPGGDLVRWGGRLDDPAGGVFDRAADEPPAWLPARLRPAPVLHPPEVKSPTVVNFT